MHVDISVQKVAHFKLEVRFDLLDHLEALKALNVKKLSVAICTWIKIAEFTNQAKVNL